MSQPTTLPLDLAPTTEGRVADDFYATPPRDTAAFLNVAGWNVTGRLVFEPCAGDGAILDVCATLGARGCGIELNDHRAAICRRKGYDVVQGDSLGTAWPDADFLLTNPPYGLALEFAELAAQWAHRTGKPAAMLLRLAFVESKKRAAFHAAWPSDIVVLSERPRFRTDRGGTDNSAYAWFCWGPQATRRWSLIPPREVAR